MAGRLRFFVYRDDAIVSQFLEQLEGGVFDEERIRHQATSPDVSVGRLLGARGGSWR
jgi:hypothetical protein